MGTPTLTSQTGSNWTDTSNTAETTGTLTWNSGDRILVVGFTEDQSLTISTPTATGLTFSALGTAITASGCWIHAWQATAGSSGSSTVSGAIVGGSGMRGLHAFAYGDCTGFTRTNGAAVNSTQTVSVTRGQANSAMVFWSADWSAGGTGGLGWTPAGQTQLQAAAAGGATAFCARWGDQGATGTTSYGTTGVPGTTFSKAAVEVLGTAAASPAAENSASAATANAGLAALAGAAGDTAAAGVAGDPAAALSPAGSPAAAAAAAADPAAALTLSAQVATSGAAAPDAIAVTAVTATGQAAAVTVTAVDPAVEAGDPPVIETLFTSETPTGTDNNDGAPGIITATTIRPAVDGTVGAVRFFASATVGGTYTVAVHEVTADDDPGPGAGTLLGSAVLSGSPTPADWNSVPLDPPVAWTAGTLYRVALHNSQGRYVSLGAAFPIGTDLVNGNLTGVYNGTSAFGGAVRNGNYELTGTATAYPNEAFNSSAYFVDVEFEAAAVTDVVAEAEAAPAGAAAGDTLPVVSAAAQNSTVSAAAGDASFTTGDVAVSAQAATAGASSDAGVVTLAVSAAVTLVAAAAEQPEVQAGDPPATESLFTSQTPSSGDNSDGSPGITTATSMQFDVDGEVTGVSFYATATVGGTYTVALWEITREDDGAGTGTLLASETMAGSPTPAAWNTVTFDSPVAVETGKTYRAGVFSGAGRYVFSAGFFASPLTNGHITAPEHNSGLLAGALWQGTFVVNAALTYPVSSPGQANYFVDVEFVAAGVSGTTATAELAAAGAEALAPAFSTGDVTAAAQAAAATAGAYEVSLPAVTESLFTSQTPSSGDNSDGSPGITTATSVQFDVDGEVAGVSFFATSTVSGTYTAALWEITREDDGAGTGTLLASETMAGSPVGEAWNTILFDTPVAVETGKTYRAGLFSSGGRYVLTSGFFASPLTNGHITAPEHNSGLLAGALWQGTFVVNAALTYPTSSSGQSNYFIDVEFDPAEVPATVAAAELASAAADALFDAGTLVSLTMVSDAPVDVLSTAGDPQASLVATAGTATAGAAAHQPVVDASGAPAVAPAQTAGSAGTAGDISFAGVVFAELATTAVDALFDQGASVSVELVSDSPVDVQAGAFDVGAVVSAAGMPAVAAGSAEQASVQASSPGAAAAEAAMAAAVALDPVTAVAVFAEAAEAGAIAYLAAVSDVPPEVVAEAQPAVTTCGAYQVVMVGNQVIVAWSSVVRDTTLAGQVRRSQ